MSTTRNDDCTHGSVRLGSSSDVSEDGEGSAGVREGRVEVCVNRAWGTVCENSFTQEEADVVCRQLPGFKPEGIYSHFYHVYTI